MELIKKDVFGKLDEDDIVIVLAKHSNVLDKLKLFMVKLNETGKDEIKINDIKRLKDDIEELKTMFIKAQEDDEKERKENEKNLKGKNKRLLHPKG